MGIARADHVPECTAPTKGPTRGRGWEGAWRGGPPRTWPTQHRSVGTQQPRSINTGLPQPDRAQAPGQQGRPGASDVPARCSESLPFAVGRCALVRRGRLWLLHNSSPEKASYHFNLVLLLNAGWFAGALPGGWQHMRTRSQVTGLGNLNASHFFSVRLTPQGNHVSRNRGPLVQLYDEHYAQASISAAHLPPMWMWMGACVCSQQHQHLADQHQPGIHCLLCASLSVRIRWMRVGMCPVHYRCRNGQPGPFS